MSLAQRELGETFRKDIKKEMSNKHIEIRFDSAKISIKEYIGERVLQPVTYQPAIIKMIGGRLLVVNPDNQEEYYDCRYEDCTIKRVNG
jgi:putative transposon-encoded protein